jgi:signal transduction histidine kinase
MEQTSGSSASARRRGLAAPLALPAGFAALLVVGAIAAASHGGLGAGWVLGLAAAIVLTGAAVSEPAVAPVLGVIGWLTVTGFSRAPYAQLQVTGSPALRAALVIAACTVAGVAGGLVLRRVASSFTLWIVSVSGPPPDEDPITGLPRDWTVPEPVRPESARPESARPESALPESALPESALSGSAPAEPVPHESAQAAGTPPLPAGLGAQPRRHLRLPDLTGGIGRRRLAAGAALLVAGLPLLTWVLSAAQMRHLSDDLLVYLVVVVAVAVVGGFWPAVLAAIGASLLVNWYFTPPVHTLTIGDGQSLLSLLLFITVAVTVSSVVHLAAHRARQAARAAGEAQELLALAQTVLGGADAPAAVLAHLTTGYGGRAELLERAGGQWIRVAVSGAPPAAADGTPARPEARAAAREDLVLVAGGQDRPLTDRLLHGFAAQAAAALDRDRLRTQAAQAEVLAEGNRMRTALLAAVSHDLRTPLASIKASVSSLRQTDVTWTEDDEAEFLATIERSSDRLDALIGNLLDMSRLTTGSLEPFLRPTAVDEVAPVALRGLDEGGRMALMVPDDLPLVRTDPGLLERVLANLFANALAYSPPSRDPELRARQDGASVLLDIVDRGRGAPDELKELMFEPFQRLDARSAGPAAAGGIGLGLAVVKGFLEIMGGSVLAADTPGGGLTMRVRLPAAVEPPPSASLPVRQPAPPRHDPQPGSEAPHPPARQPPAAGPPAAQPPAPRPPARRPPARP